MRAGLHGIAAVRPRRLPLNPLCCKPSTAKSRLLPPIPGYHRPLPSELARYKSNKEEAARAARQRVALQLACGFDLDQIATAGKEALNRSMLRLRRAMERERLRGRRQHWSYDLNRHIAMKEALDRLKLLESSELEPAAK